VKLTPEQQIAIVEHLGNAKAWALRYRGPIPLDERLSIAYEALCEAALTCPPVVSYSGWAKAVVRNRLVDASRRWGLWMRWHAPESWGVDVAVDTGTDIAAIETRELAAVFRCRFHLLSNTERKVMELFCEGWQWSEIGRKIGSNKKAIWETRKRATRKLLDPGGVVRRAEIRAASGTANCAKHRAALLNKNF